MSSKNNTEVILGGKVFTLSGYESEEYLQKVAAYINNKLAEFNKDESYRRQSAEVRANLMYLNIADDYFKAAEQARESQKQRDDMEKESYSLKHDLVTMQMKLENLERKLQEAEQKQKQAEEELLKIKAVQTASAASAHGNNQNFFSGNNGHR